MDDPIVGTLDQAVGQLPGASDPGIKLTEFGPGVADDQPGGQTYDTNSYHGIGDRDNTLTSGFSVALTPRERLHRFGVDRPSTGKVFMYEGQTYRDDDTAAQFFRGKDEGRRIDVFRSGARTAGDHFVGMLDGTRAQATAKSDPVVGQLDQPQPAPRAELVKLPEKPEEQNQWDIGKAWQNLFGQASQASAGLDVAGAQEALNRAKSGEPKPTILGLQEEKDKQALANPNISQADAQEIIARRRAQTDMDQQIAQRDLERAKAQQDKAFLATPGPEYQRTIPGTVTRFLGQAAPFLLSGSLGAAGPLAMATQMSEQGYGEQFGRAMQQGRQAHPEWSDEQLRTAADKAAREAAQTGFENGVVMGLLPVPKVGPLVARMVEQIGLRGAYMAVAGASQDIESNMQLKKEVDPRQAIYEGVLAHAPANFAAGAAFGVPEAIGEAFNRPAEAPPTPQERPRAQPKVETAETPQTQPDKVVGELDKKPEESYEEALKRVRQEFGNQDLEERLPRGYHFETDENGMTWTVGPDGSRVQGKQIPIGPGTEPVPSPPPELERTEGTDQWVSAIANRYAQERVTQGEIGEIVPGEGYSRTDLRNRGLRMSPEEINQHVSDLMHNTGNPKLQAAAITAEEARLSQRSSQLSRIADDNPLDQQARINADNAFNDLTDFHNGPVAKLKNNWHAQGMTLQGEVPVDLSTFNGLREAWLRDVGTRPSRTVEMTMRNTATRVRNAVDAEDAALQRLGQGAEKSVARKPLLTDEQVRNNIMARMKNEPCIT